MKKRKSENEKEREALIGWRKKKKNTLIGKLR